jgi:starch phosphorylase
MQMLYQPAHDAWMNASAGDFAIPRERAEWNRHVERNWDRVRIVDPGCGGADTLMSGKPVKVRTVVDLGGLRPEDLRVEAIVGRLAANGFLEETEVIQLRHESQEGNGSVFTREFVPQHTGRLGLAVRVSPNHFEDPLTRPCHPRLKWSS